MSRRALLLLLGALLSGVVHAQETPQDWIKRTLDPATIGVTPFPGSELSRKLTVDTIRLADPRKRIAIYLAPFDQLQAASDHFAATLRVQPAISGGGTQFARHFFRLAGSGTYLKSAEGLTVLIFRSPYADDKAQIELEYIAPAR